MTKILIIQDRKNNVTYRDTSFSTKKNLATFIRTYFKNLTKFDKYKTFTGECKKSGMLLDLTIVNY